MRALLLPLSMFLSMPFRLLALVLPGVLMAGAARADDVMLTSGVSAVTLYPQGGSVTRSATFELPAGQHRLILADLPKGTPLATVRAEVAGVRMGSVSTRSDFVPPRDGTESDALKAARAEVTRLEGALRDGEAQVARIRAEAQAAQDRLAFLSRIGQGGGAADLPPERLRALAGMIADESLSARRAAQDADAHAGAVDRALEETRTALKAARARVRALVPEEATRAMVAVSVEADHPAKGSITLRYVIDDAGWQPVAEFRLDRAAARVGIERGALVHQATGENWRGVALALSTGRPSGRIAPGEVHPWLPRIVDPEKEPRPVPMVRMEGARSDAFAVAGKAAAPVTAEARADALQIRYEYPRPVDVASGADRLRLSLGRAGMDAQVVAQAVPLTDNRAYLVADVTNGTGQPILPTEEARFYLDGRYVGQERMDAVPAGGEARLPFGPIDGLRLKRQVLNRHEGDSGIITRRSGKAESYRLSVENLTGEAWPVRLVDRVPRSEQEDLRIDWSAMPAPDQEDVDGRRGVLAWRFDVAPGQTREVTLTYSLRWPEGMELR